MLKSRQCVWFVCGLKNVCVLSRLEPRIHKGEKGEKVMVVTTTHTRTDRKEKKAFRRLWVRYAMLEFKHCNGGSGEGRYCQGCGEEQVGQSIMLYWNSSMETKQRWWERYKSHLNTARRKG